jgi:hypothetical protein
MKERLLHTNDSAQTWHQAKVAGIQREIVRRNCSTLMPCGPVLASGFGDDSGEQPLQVPHPSEQDEEDCAGVV